MTLGAGDAGLSGVAATYYTLDGGDPQTYGGAFVVSDEGVHEVTYWSVDALGNTEAADTGYVNIDTTAPATTASGLQASAASGWRNAPQSVTLLGDDAGLSGVAATYYTLDGGPRQSYTGAFEVSAAGSHTIVYWSVDAAGNSETPHTGGSSTSTPRRRASPPTPTSPGTTAP